MSGSAKRRGLPGASVHDVARLAGVSQAAVSRAFTPGASIAKATKERVLDAASQLGYRPNLLAKSLIKGVSDLIGVVIGDARYPFFVPVLDEMCTRLSQADKHCLVFTSKTGVPADVHVEDLLRYRIGTLVLMYSGISRTMIETCRRAGIQIIFFSWRPPGTLCASITCNDESGAHEVAGHLVDQGYRNIACISGPDASPTSKERQNGFTAGLKARGFPKPMHECGFLSREEAVIAARKLLSNPEPPDAIFCTNDMLAQAALEVARFEFGLEIGRQVGIAGFDDVQTASWPSFDLTTYAQSVEPMVERVVEMVLADEPLNADRIIIEGSLKKRGSTQRDPKS